MTTSACLVPGCPAPAAAGSPVGLCRPHADEVSDWVRDDDGITDVLPSPCRACGSRLGVRWPSGWTCAVCEWRIGEDADPDLPPPRLDVVYYLRHGDRVKIGTTMNPRQRFAQLLHDELLALERGDRVLEHARHNRFAEDRLGTSEWFRLSPAIEAHLVVLGRGSIEPWDLWARWRSEALALRG